MQKRIFPFYLVSVLLLGSFSGCSGVDAVTNHATLEVHTHMSETIFLDPVTPSLHTIYIGMRNTSDYPDLDVRGALAQALTQRGYTIVNDPAAAHYLLQGNVLQAGRLAKGQENSLLSEGFGQPLLAGAAAGALTGGLTGNSDAGIGVGLGIAAASALINYAYQDITYAITVDLQLSERPLHGGTIRQQTQTFRGTNNYGVTAAVTDRSEQSYGASTSSSLNSNGRSQTIDETSEFKKYNVRDIAYANQVNLKLEQAIPTLVQHLASSFANLFE